MAKPVLNFLNTLIDMPSGALASLMLRFAKTVFSTFVRKKTVNIVFDLHSTCGSGCLLSGKVAFFEKNYAKRLHLSTDSVNNQSLINRIGIVNEK